MPPRFPSFNGLNSEERMELVNIIQKWVLAFNNGRWDELGNRKLLSKDGGNDLQQMTDRSIHIMAKLVGEI